MKRILIFCFVFLPNVLNAQSADHGNISLGSLATKENKIVQSYSGFLFNVFLIGNEPFMSVNFVDVKNKQTQDLETKLVLFVKTNASASDKAAALKQIEDLKSFKPVTVLQSGTIQGNNGNQLVRFDSLDSNNNIILSEWREIKTGFEEKSAIFDENGDLLSFKFYLKLKINVPSPNPRSLEKPVILSLDKVIERHKGLILNRVDDLEELGVILINETMPGN